MDKEKANNASWFIVGFFLTFPKNIKTTHVIETEKESIDSNYFSF